VLWRVSGDMIWDRLLKRIFGFAGEVADRFQHGSLRQHISLLVLAIAGFALIGVVSHSTADDLVWPDSDQPANIAGLARLHARGNRRGGRGDDAGAGGAGGNAGRERAGHGDDLPRRVAPPTWRSRS
jgi:hypothetical protein